MCIRDSDYWKHYVRVGGCLRYIVVAGFPLKTHARKTKPVLELIIISAEMATVRYKSKIFHPASINCQFTVSSIEHDLGRLRTTLWCKCWREDCRLPTKKQKCNRAKQNENWISPVFVAHLLTRFLRTISVLYGPCAWNASVSSIFPIRWLLDVNWRHPASFCHIWTSDWLLKRAFKYLHLSVVLHRSYILVR